MLEEEMKAKSLVAAFAILYAAAPVWAGTVYYVNGANGSDSNLGTQEAPWKTIQKAALTMVAGDEACVAEGNYAERVTVTRSGASGAMISFVASGIVQCQGFTIRGSYIRVKGFKLTATKASWSEEGYGIWLEGSNCSLEDNHLYYCPTGGIMTWISSSSSTIRNNRCERNCLTGLEIRGDNHLIENNEIWGTIAHHSLTNWTPTGDANGIGVCGTGHVFRSNFIHDIRFDDPETVGYSPHIDAFQTFAVDTYHPRATNILIEKNRIVLPVYKDANAKGVGFMLDSCHHITIRNNIVLAFNTMNTAEGSVNNIKIENNTLVGRLDFPRTYWPSAIDLQNCPYSVVRNNIIFNQAYYAVHIDSASQTGLEVSNNCIFNENGTIPSGTHFPYDLWATNPSFANPASEDYHLDSNSPCIDSGMTVPEILDDYDGVPRPSGRAYDIGAYEYGEQTFLPSVTTSSASSITTSGATLGGNVTSDGGAKVTERGICWGLSANPTISGLHTHDGSGTGSYTSNLTDLAPNTTYHIRAYATNGLGTSYGGDIAFTTLQEISLPAVITSGSVSLLSVNSATIGGNVISDGGSPVTERGVCWGMAVNPTISELRTHDGSGTGSFTSTLIGLSADTTYHIRAYATNAVGTSYGSDVTILTNKAITLPSVTTVPASSITTSTATVGGNVTSDGGASVTMRGVCWGLTTSPTISGLYTQAGAGTGIFTSSLVGLTPGTTYYARAYATNSAGTAYGADLTFTTPSNINIPSVTTNAVASVLSSTSVILGGIVTSDGGAIVTKRGICWGLSSNPTITGTHTHDGSGTGIYTSSLTGLAPITTYHARAYATNSAGTGYGNEVTFTTSRETTLPSVTTSAPTSITSTGATVGGNVTSDGGETVILRGVCWALSANPTTSGSHTQAGSGTGSFTSSLVGLIPGTTYHVRAYATNSSGTSYGADTKFTTSRERIPRILIREISTTTKNKKVIPRTSKKK